MEEIQGKSCFFEYESSNDSIRFAKGGAWKQLDGVWLEGCIEEETRPVFIYPEDLKIWKDFLKKEQGGECNLRLLEEGGKPCWCCFKAFSMPTESGYKLLGCVFDIDEQVKEKEYEEYLSRLDLLTGVFDAANARMEIDTYLKTSGKTGSHAMIVVDIDDLKSINTNLGYLFGDAVIANMAEAFQESIPEDSVIGRIGGDEFIIFLKNISGMEQVMESAERIRSALQEVYVGEYKELKITCCMGIVRYPIYGKTYQELFENADKALFQAKENGKNMIQMYDQTLLHCLPEKESGYYNQYRMHDSQSLFRGEGQKIIHFAFDIMAKTKDVSSAVKLLMEKIGREYHVDSVGIIETEKGRTRLNVTYEWHAKKSDVFDIEIEETVLLRGDCFDSQGLYMKEGAGGSVLMAAFYEEGKFRGCVGLKDASGHRLWSNDEKEKLIEISKIVSFYLLKLRVSEKISERLEHMKNYDTMTGLSTLYKFKKDMAQMVAERPQRYAVVYWDISNFKFINETYGYQAGDRVLYDLAVFLKGYLNQEDCLLARDSADKFVGLCPVTDIEEFRRWLNKIGQEFHELQKEKNISVNLTVVSGTYLIEEGNQDISTAIDNANVARKAAKGGISSACRFYDEDMEESIRREIEILNNMEEALKNKEFIVYLQPKIDLDGEKPAGAEALVRWRRFDGSMVAPSEFIPLFEKNGFILDLDFYVYEEVCQTIRRWLNNNMKIVPISMNVSRVHLNDGQFIFKLKKLVDFYQVPPELVELELTESMFLDNTKVALATMQELRKMGFSVSIDDFGAGYSSLSLLKDMATDVIKLDKEFFVHDELLNEEKIVVSSIINMAKQLNMKVLSEGIETKKQTEFLKEMDCDMVQGYFYAKPMPIREFERFLNSN